MPPQGSPSGLQHAQRPYCLYCYAPMARTHEASAACACCGARNLRVDQDIFWTREPWLRRLELFGKASVSLFVGWITYELLFSFDGGFGVPQGVAIGAPILIAVVLWDTVSKLTRKNPYFNAALFWSILPIVLGAPLFLVGVSGVVKALRSGAFGAPRRSGDPWGMVCVLLVGALFLGIALASRVFGRRLRAWQERRVLERQVRLERDAAPARYPLRP